jgi:hypothetical protein
VRRIAVFLSVLGFERTDGDDGILDAIFFSDNNRSSPQPCFSSVAVFFFFVGTKKEHCRFFFFLVSRRNIKMMYDHLSKI